MKSLAKAYSSWSDERKNFMILVIIALVGFAVFCFGFFMNNPGLPLGWLLGSVIELICYVTIVKGSSFILDGSGDSKRGLLGAAFGTLRLVLYAAGLVVGGFCTYSWGTVSNGYCNIWTVFGAYLPVLFVVIFATLLRNKKSEPENNASNENKEEKK